MEFIYYWLLTLLSHHLASATMDMFSVRLRYRWSKGHHSLQAMKKFWESLGGKDEQTGLNLPIWPERKMLEISQVKTSGISAPFSVLDSMNEQINNCISISK